jgi:hypothetical protein
VAVGKRFGVGGIAQRAIGPSKIDASGAHLRLFAGSTRRICSGELMGHWRAGTNNFRSAGINRQPRDKALVQRPELVAAACTRIRKGAAISDPDESTRQASVREQSRSSDRAAQLCECCKRPASTGGCTCFSLIASAREAAPRSRTEDESERAMGACLGWGSDGR